MIEALVGVDPGEATGLCRVFPAAGYELSWTMDQFSACDWLVEAAKGYGPRLMVATERFILRRGTYDFKPASIEVNGVLKWCHYKYGIGLVEQLVSDAKAFVSNERLRKLEWWNRGGADHERDACRHVLLYLARSGMYDGTTVKWGTTT